MKSSSLDKMLSFRVDPETHAKVEAIAESEKRRLADVVRLLFLRALAKFDVRKDRL